jgi:hypothetical protein
MIVVFLNKGTISFVIKTLSAADKEAQLHPEYRLLSFTLSLLVFMGERKALESGLSLEFLNKIFTLNI